MNSGLATQSLTRDVEDIAHPVLFDGVRFTQVFLTFDDADLALNACRNPIAQRLNGCAATARDL